MKHRLALCSITIAVFASEPAGALPSAPDIVCATYPDAGACFPAPPSCNLCHTSPPIRNAFGDQLEVELALPRPLDASEYDAALPLALAAVAGLDADGDGASNLEELLAGTWPADPGSRPADDTGDTCELQASWQYDVCDRDVAFTYRRVMLDVCGRSPSIDELLAVSETPDPWAAVHGALDECLRSEFWLRRDGVLWNLANRKIRPTRAIKSGEGAGDIPLADYFDDYNLFVYTQSGDRDARDVLLAQYFVERIDGEHTTYRPFDRTPVEDVKARGRDVGQLVPANRRVGMLTSRWFLVFNTMFTAVPRTAAAQAYRSYLGLDIAKSQGLMPVGNEPVDFDGKGVTKPECAFCHSTLDPLTYPFTRYNGLSGAIPATYEPDRLSRFAQIDGPEVVDTPEAGVLFGQQVDDLLEWGQVAANSPEFARATVLDYWNLMVGDAPGPDELDQFEMLVADFQGDNDYRVERMLHDLIETEAYSVP